MTGAGVRSGERFETYVAGAQGALAVTAARAVAESRHPPYNPLFLVGPPGFGKSHLLSAIEGLAAHVDPARRVLRVTAEGFSADQGDEWRTVDLLLLDDMDQLPRRGEAQQVLAEVLEARADTRRATVLTSALAPEEIPNADARLVRVAASGLVVELDLPGPDRRLALLRTLPAEPALDPAVMEALALLPVRNIRELLGAFRRLVAFQAVSQHPLDVSQATVLLGGMGAGPGEPAGPPGDLPGAVVATTDSGDDPRPPRVPAEEEEPRADEFGDFLSEVVATVAEQVDRWRERVGAAILRWEGEGIRTARLERLLREEFPEDPDALLAEFERDAEGLLSLARDARALDPEGSAGPAFQDPDDLAGAHRALDQIRLRVAGLPGPDPDWRLEAFVDSTSTRAALRALDRLLGGDAGDNPVVVQGASGSGKTHLLHGFGTAWMERHGGVVACLSSSDFTGDPAAWWSGIRTASALLVDDLDRIVSHPTQGLLADALEALVTEHRPVVVTTSVPLRTLSGVESRLLSRLDAGAIVDLEAPDRELRARLVMHALPEAHRDAAALIDAIASRAAPSARAVQATVQRVLAAAGRRGVTPTASLVREALDAIPTPADSRVRSGSGLQNPLLTGARLQEKIIPVWPQVTDQLLEEFR